MVARAEGFEEGIEIGTIKTAINIFREDMHLSNEDIIEKLIVKFGITREEARVMVHCDDMVMEHCDDKNSGAL